MSALREGRVAMMAALSRFAHRYHHPASLGEEYEGNEAERPVVDIEHATLVSSRTHDNVPPRNIFASEIIGEPGEPVHTVVLDLDVPAHLAPSSRPGHSHLYIDVQMGWSRYEALLEALGTAGILEPGYVLAAKAREATMVRLPDLVKAPNGKDAVYRDGLDYATAGTKVALPAGTVIDDGDE